MNQTHPILKGAFILTVTGFATRILGFFYRIFLSRTFGEEGVGIYQLIFPVFALGFSLTCAGIETAISRTVAQKHSLGKQNEATSILVTGCALSLVLSVTFMMIIQQNAAYIAFHFLNEPRCEPLLYVLSYTFPFASLHSCICGYYLGLKQTKIPAISQFIEQVIRVCSVFFIYLLAAQNENEPNILIAVAGLFFGEFASSLYCFFSWKRHANTHPKAANTTHNYGSNLHYLLPLAIPLTANRVLLNILQSIEAVSIPSQLQAFGFSTTQALSIYGVLTGMALPCILFPSAITNSVASMMLPTVAEIQAKIIKEPSYQSFKK